MKLLLIFLACLACSCASTTTENDEESRMFSGSNPVILSGLEPFREAVQAVTEFVAYKHSKAMEFLSADGGLVDMMRPKGELERMAEESIRREMAAAKVAEYVRRLFSTIRVALNDLQYALFSHGNDCSVATTDLEDSINQLVKESEMEERSLVEVVVVGAGKREGAMSKRVMRGILADGRKWGKRVGSVKQRVERLLKEC